MAVVKSSNERVEERRERSVPHGVQVEHGRLQLGQLDGGDADGPDVAQLVVTAVLLHRRHFRSHPVEKNKKNKNETMFLIWSLNNISEVQKTQPHVD